MNRPIYGFALLKNGIKYDYCFIESLTSLSHVTKKIHLALGDNDDETEKELDQIQETLKIIPTVWNKASRSGGVILSEQTNIALDDLRKYHGQEEGAWGIYLQCDEVFHEDDIELIKSDIKKAQDSGCDVMTFRYLHFWQSHHDLAINKKWYPQEIRAVKLNSSIESWGDAQGFRNYEKVYHSEARIYHYGHVREQDKYKDKKADILKLYHQDDKISKYKRRERRYDNMTETLIYWGSHPKIIHERIKRMGENPIQEKREIVWVVGDRSDLEDSFIERIHCEKIEFVSHLSRVPRVHRASAVILKKGLWRRIFSKGQVPKKMRSPLALEWKRNFYLTLVFSEKGIGVNL